MHLKTHFVAMLLVLAALVVGNGMAVRVKVGNVDNFKKDMNNPSSLITGGVSTGLALTSSSFGGYKQYSDYKDRKAIEAAAADQDLNKIEGARSDDEDNDEDNLNPNIQGRVVENDEVDNDEDEMGPTDGTDDAKEETNEVNGSNLIIRGEYDPRKKLAGLPGVVERLVTGQGEDGSYTSAQVRFRFSAADATTEMREVECKNLLYTNDGGEEIDELCDDVSEDRDGEHAWRKYEVTDGVRHPGSVYEKLAVSGETLFATDKQPYRRMDRVVHAWFFPAGEKYAGLEGDCNVPDDASISDGFQACMEWMNSEYDSFALPEDGDDEGEVIQGVDIPDEDGDGVPKDGSQIHDEGDDDPDVADGVATLVSAGDDEDSDGDKDITADEGNNDDKDITADEGNNDDKDISVDGGSDNVDIVNDDGHDSEDEEETVHNEEDEETLDIGEDEETLDSEEEDEETLDSEEEDEGTVDSEEDEETVDEGVANSQGKADDSYYGANEDGVSDETEKAKENDEDSDDLDGQQESGDEGEMEMEIGLEDKKTEKTNEDAFGNVNVLPKPSSALIPSSDIQDAGLPHAGNGVASIHEKTNTLLKQDVSKMSLDEKLDHLKKLHQHAADLSDAMDALQSQLKAMDA